MGFSEAHVCYETHSRRGLQRLFKGRLQRLADDRRRKPVALQGKIDVGSPPHQRCEKKDLQITPHLEKYIEEHLKKTFEEDPDPYRTFINMWGTHFFHKAHFGGLIRVLMEMDSSFAEKKTQHAIGVQASGIIEGIQLSAGFGSESKSMNSDFQKHTSVTKRILGGKYSVFLKEGFNAWQTTVAGSPWLYKGKLMSVHLLIKDAKKRKEMLKAIDEHMMKAQLEAARRMAKKKLLEMMGDQLFREKKLQSYIKKCDELMIKDFPKKDVVSALYKKIENAMLWKKKLNTEFLMECRKQSME